MNILVTGETSGDLWHLIKCLREYDHNVYSAKDGMEAWETLCSRPIDILISDRMIPEMRRLELFEKIRNAEFKNYIYLILVADEGTTEETFQGLKSEVDDYITKPIKFEQLKARIELGARIAKLESEATSRYDDIKRNYYQTIRMFTSLIEIFDEDLGGHCRRVGKLCLELAKRHSGVSAQDFAVVEGAGLLHDVGMIGLPTEILSKKRTERNDDERKLYFSHPERGAIILNEVELLQPIARLVRAHHEQFNGRGFPDGLKAGEIPLLAIILSAASIYDNFVYRGKVLLQEIPVNLQRLRGHQLEPFIVDLLLDINREKIQEEEGKDFREVALSELQEGMVLARDIRMKTGALAMPSDTAFTGYSIEKLNSYSKLDCISGKVYVYKDSVRG